MSNLRNNKNQEARNLDATFCFSKSGLSAGTTAGTLRTTAASDYAIGGIAYSRAATDNSAVTAGLTAVAASMTALFVVALDAAGAIFTLQGRAVPTATALTTTIPQTPVVPDNMAAIGAFKIVTSNAASYTPGTTAFNAAGVTTTFFDLARVPVTL